MLVSIHYKAVTIDGLRRALQCATLCRHGARAKLDHVVSVISVRSQSDSPGYYHFSGVARTK